MPFGSVEATDFDPVRRGGEGIHGELLLMTEDVLHNEPDAGFFGVQVRGA